MGHTVADRIAMAALATMIAGAIVAIVMLLWP
jgi:hypothetical protein